MTRLILSDRSSWPRPALETDSHYGVAHALRYAQQQVTPADLMEAASIIEAYGMLVVETTQKRRNFVCREIRQQLEVEQ